MTYLLKCLIPTIGSPATIGGEEGRYALAAFYGELLGMKIVNEDWLLIAADPPGKFFIALDRDGWDEGRPPRWPDPEYPQQIHLDVLVPDVEAAGAAIAARGATLLRDNGAFRVYADPVGHPFCLYADESVGQPVVRRLVFDCYSPRALAVFYQGFLGASRRVVDSPERVVLDLGDESLPDLAFQHAEFRAARWPDPDYPAQVHVDYRWHDGVTARTALERAETFGAVPLQSRSGVYADPASHPFCIQNEIPVVFDIVGLYVNPPEYAVVYAVDETSQTLDLDGLGSAAAAKSGEQEQPDRSNTVPELAVLLASLADSASTAAGAPGRVQAFLEFLRQVESTLPSHFAMNLVCGWDGTYEDAAVQSWLVEHSHVQAHRNPPESSWDVEVPRWVAYYTDELIRRGEQPMAQALDADIRSWARRRSDQPEPFVWSKARDEILESAMRPGRGTRGGGG